MALNVKIEHSSFKENPAPNLPIGVLSVEGASADEAFTFELLPSDELRFSILPVDEDQAGRVIYALVIDENIDNNNVAFDYENNELNSFTISVTANGDKGHSVTSAITLSVNNANEAPTDVVINGGTIAENSLVGSEIASLKALDPDHKDTFTYTFVTDASGETEATNALFKIDGDKIKLQAALDDANVGTYKVWVKATDAEGLSVTKEVTLTVTNSAEVFSGTPKNDRVTGTADDDTINADAGNDWLDGLAGNDILNGAAGVDTLYGREGNDTLNGGAGKDKLYGGAGQDLFVFDTPVKKGQFDQVFDFKSSDDTFQFNLSALKAFKVKGPKKSDLISKKGADDHHGKPDDKGGGKSVGFDKIFKKGHLEKKFFNVGTKLSDKPDGSNDYIFYNKKSGIVYLDVDGSGSGKGIEILKVKPGTALTADDFLFI